eukprot:TRINITY_DN11097_c0_g1_i1.p1 TRINITY_DN11097_c0_g1~~TRINITY_DN11097_c0_g1_i1.p1  ORF type:complete len:210 (+),score=30.56 TRINITY_DN11097_c0_g1_i1:47-676(+)
MSTTLKHHKAWWEMKEQYEEGKATAEEFAVKSAETVKKLESNNLRTLILENGLLAADKCWDKSEPCLNSWVYLGRVMSARPIGEKMIATRWNMKERVGRLVTLDPENPEYNELAGRALLDSHVTMKERFWATVSGLQYPPAANTSQAVPLLMKAYDKEPTVSRSLFIADAYRLSNQKEKAKEWYETCKNYEIDEHKVIDVLARDECCYR